MNYIQDNTQLKTCCEAIANYPAIALDTEFVRERTFYPALGLIQLQAGDNTYLIDPLSITEWQPFVDVLVNPEQCKVLHACGEDIEVLNYFFKCTPVNLFDSQIAEAFLGGRSSIGLAALLEQYQGVKLSKEHARTNWIKRPLSDAQLAYAADDVIYLLNIYQQQRAQLEQKGLMSWVQDDIQTLINKRSHQLDPKLAWREIKSAWQLSPRSLAVLKPLTEWRLTVAREKNLAVNFVVHEREIIILAERRPSSVKSLRNIPGIHPSVVKRHANKLIELVEQGKAIAIEDCPPKVNRVAELRGYKQIFSALKDVIEDKAKEMDLSVDVVASKRMINEYIGYHYQVNAWSQESLPELLKNWRGECLADALLQAVNAVEI